MFTEKEWGLEEQRLEQVRSYITKRIRELNQMVQERKDDVVSLRKHFWDDITVNVDNMDEIVETMASIRQQSFVLYGQEKGLEHAGQLLDRMERMHGSPYFGRIDFLEDGNAQEDTIYIGIGSVIDEESGEPYVYDWRAPIASMFYDYASGAAQFESPDGTISGELTLKRQYVIEDGKLVSMFDTGLHIGDEMLQQMLGKHADERMKNIVSTIQSEQNRIIRDDRHDVLIVQGAAGSGKTSAALQRIAYLLYKYRKSLNPEQMILLTPNEVFQDYISEVLPELGESNIRQSTFYEYAESRLGREVIVEHPYDHLESLYSQVGNVEREEGIKYKSSTTFLLVLDQYLDLLLEEGMLFKPFMIGKKTLVSTEALKEMFYETFGDRNLQGRLDAMRLRIADVLKEQAHKLTNQIYRKKMKQPGYTGTSEELLQQSRRQVKKRIIPLRRMAMERRFIDWQAIYLQLFEEPRWFERCAGGDIPRGWEEASRLTAESLRRSKVLYEDSAPLLYLKEQFEGFHSDNNIRYVLIDEAQDYSPIQLAIVRRMFPRSRITLLGDLNQSVFSLTGLSTYQHIESMFDTSNVGVIRLAKSYRSTREIVEFTKAVLKNGEEIEAFSRSGDAPKLLVSKTVEEHTAAIVSDMARLQEAGCESIAVICKTEQECQQAYELLSLHAEVQLVTRTTRKFGSGVLIIPSYMAKGLEFDGVIVYDASEDVYGLESDRKVLYTVCTRALHHLSVHSLGSSSPLLP